LKNSDNNPSFSLGELAAKIGGTLDLPGNRDIQISGAAPIETAGPSDISFVANSRYTKFISATKAGALVLDATTESHGHAVIRHNKPYLTFARIVDILYPAAPLSKGAIHATTSIDNTAVIDSSAVIGPFCVIGANCRISSKTHLMSSIFIGERVTIGKNCLLYPGVKILDRSHIGDNVILHAGVVIGSDGFGYAESETGLYKIKQIGHVEIGNDVEIGANTTIDRGALGPTKIGHGTKIDNLVQIGHNVEIGQHSIIVAQTGIAGSVKIGNGVVIGGQVGLAGHITISDGVKIGSQAGVSNSLSSGKVVWGTPARELMEIKRIEACLTRLPELLKRVKKIEDKLLE